MDLRPDELAGTVDCFGALTRTELLAVLADLAARTGDDGSADAPEAIIDAALDSYHLLQLDPAALEAPTEGLDEPLLVPGPAALPRLPAGGEDLPHLLDVEPRSVDRDAAARAAETRLRQDAAAAIADEDPARGATLLDACYELEAWSPVDLADAKAELASLVE